MPTETGKPLIVISYAHADEPEHPAEGEVKWLSFVTGYLRPAIKHGAVDLWLDRIMPGGADWRPEIEQKLGTCDIFILLVSRHSLSSDYVVDKEIPIIRERRANGEAVHFYPLVLTPTPRIALNLVRDKNLRPRDGKPLSDYSAGDRDWHMNEAANEIAEIAKEIGERRMPTIAQSSSHAVSAIPARQGGSADQSAALSAIANVIDRGTLEVWLRPQPREVLVTIAARAVLRVVPLCGYGDYSLTAATFRGIAAARAAGKYPARAKEIWSTRAAAAVETAIDAARAHSTPDNVFATGSLDVARAAVAAAFAADSLASSADAVADAAAAVDADVKAAVEIIQVHAILDEYTAPSADAFIAARWSEIRADLESVVRGGAAALTDLPLWWEGMPKWVAKEWVGGPLFSLWKGEHWDAWTDWYEERLRGVPRDEAYDLVFARVPQDEWDKGPAAANAWIKAHLPKTR